MNLSASTRKKAIRSLVSSILAGGFSDQEIEAISFAFIRRDDFTAQVGILLRERSQQLSLHEKISPNESKLSNASSEAYELVKRSGVSQKRLINILTRFNPSAAKELDSKRLTTVRLIEKLLREHPAEANLILRQLAEENRVLSPDKDPYLELIGKRLEP